MTVDRRDFIFAGLGLAATAGLPAFGRGRYEQLNVAHVRIAAGAERPFSVLHVSDTHLTLSGDDDPESLRRKYGKNLWANEISLLPYYIAAANIETEYAARNGGRRRPFPGIVLTDTFNATSLEHETERRVGELEPLLRGVEEEIAAAGVRAEEEIDSDNDERLKAERKSVIEIIVGNPPYSARQRSGNDNNQNQKYAC